MFHSHKIILKEAVAVKYEVFKKDKQLSYGQFLSSLQSDQAFRSFFVDLLKGVPFRAYHWETPPVTETTVGQPFEFVVTKSSGIDLPPDPGPFQQYFGDSSSDNDVAVFNNLGNDARLVAPTPRGEDRNYSHIGVFTEQAPDTQQYSLWSVVGRVTEESLSDRPTWLNTAGGGVAWLHVRLDSRPKYYRHRPYADLKGSS